MKNKKSQVSFEFILIFSVIFFALVSFVYVINTRLFEITEQQDMMLMENLADNIVNEIILASSVENNYVRIFDLPVNLRGQEYNIFLIENNLKIGILGNEKAEFYKSLPINVKGNFFENITVNTTEHCISKSEFDGIRISKNQLSLDSDSSTVEKGSTFSVFIGLNCVFDVKSFSFTIDYDDDKLALVDAEPVIRKNHDFDSMNPLFDDYSLIFDYRGKYDESGHKLIDDGRFSYGLIGKNCGSGVGKVARIIFEVKDNAEEGNTIIKFDDVVDENIKILDCKTNRYTRKGLPSTKKETVIEIV